MSRGGVSYPDPGMSRRRFVIGPVTRLGKWAVGLVAATLVLVVAAVTFLPGDSLAAWVVTLSGIALGFAGGVACFDAILRREERALSVYATALVFVGAVLFVLLHSLFISD
jgi:hypothetical protein